jgi:Ca2+-binding RTX toxin-like protein
VNIINYWIDLDNIIIGNTGLNILIGGQGSDTLNGGLGKDTLTGGSDSDIFIFNTVPNTKTNLDTITDFNVTDDTIQLENAVFTGLVGTGTLDSTMFRSGAGVTAAGDSSDRIAYNTTTGALYYDADGLGGTAAVQIALIGNKANLTFDDLVVI